MADATSQEKDGLEPIEPTQLLRRLKLTTGKAAQFAGVSRRQLTYWTDTGIVPSLDADAGEDDDSGRRAYDFDALHRVLLIKRALENTPGLRRAAREVERHLSDHTRQREELAASIEQQREEFLTEQAEKLEDLAQRLAEVAPKLRGREQLVDLYHGLRWLDRLADQVMAGRVILEEDAESCLRLASLIEQAEARVESLSSQAD